MSGSQTTDPADPAGLVGTVIDGRYAVERLIGRGGMGHVYRANHIRIQKPVAVKVLSQLQARRRFQREALATARIDHPNSVMLTDSGQLEDGTLFLVMELLVGETLADALESDDSPTPLAPLRALRICRDVLAALGTAHKQGVVHRDIKPENIHLSTDDNGEETAKVLDFGIAKLITDATANQSDDKLTEVGMAIGTPTYMSPEQGFGTAIDGRSDIYSMTVVLFEMLVGKPPYRGETPIDTVKKHVSAPLVTLDSVNASLPELAALEAIIAKGMAKNPADRFSTAAALADAIEPILGALAKPKADLAKGGSTTTLDAAAHKKGDIKTEVVSVGAPIGPAIPANRTIEATKRSLSDIVVIASRKTSLLTRRAHAFAKQHAMPLAGIAAALIVLLVVILASSSSSSSDSSATSLSAVSLSPKKWLAKDTPEPSPLAQEATDLLDSDQAAEALALLKQSRLSDDATADLVRGHANAATGNPFDALQAYTHALDAEPRLASDETLNANLLALTESRRLRVARGAVVLLGRTIDSSNSDKARERLVEIASLEKRRNLRLAAQQVAAQHDLEGLDYFSMHSFNLRQGRNCKERRMAVQKLKELGDKAAIPLLRKATRRMSGGLLGIGARNINGCLRDDAAEAIIYLQSL